MLEHFSIGLQVFIKVSWEFFKNHLKYNLAGCIIYWPDCFFRLGAYFFHLEICIIWPLDSRKKFYPIKCQCCPQSIETSQLTCTNYLAGFYIRATLALNGLRSLIRKFRSFAKWFMGLLVLNHVIQIRSFAFVVNIYKIYKTMYKLLNKNAKLIVPYKLDYEEILKSSNVFYTLVTLSALTNVCLSLTI